MRSLFFALIGSLFLLSCESDFPENELIFKQFSTEYDRRTGQQPVSSHKQIDQFFDGLKTVRYKDRPDHSFFVDLKAGKHHGLLKQKYYVVKGDEIFGYVVGEYRLLEFLSKDEHYYKNYWDLEAGREVFFLLDRKAMHKLLDLMEELAKKGLDVSEMWVRYGYRHPDFNRRIRGAKGSRHTKGQAVDLHIGDLNRDGTGDAKDKAIVLEILEKKLIRDKGGIGLYPGTQVVHFDTRGYRARWNSYKVNQ